MGRLDGRVAIVTGAGRGIGASEAKLFAQQGAAVVVNDFDGKAAETVAQEIVAAGGSAIASQGDVTSFSYGETLFNLALSAFGELNILVNNAGFTKDSMIFSMTEEQWDQIMAVHLKGHFTVTRFAAEYWRGMSKASKPVRAAIVNTASGTGLFGNLSQSNYAAAKAGIAMYSLILAQELGKYGVRVNCIAPNARTDLTLSTAGLRDLVQPPKQEGAFDPWDAENVAPLTVWLASDQCQTNGGVFFQIGGRVSLVEGWREVSAVGHDAQRLTLADLDDLMPALVEGRDPNKPTSQGSVMQELVASALAAAATDSST